MNKFKFLALGQGMGDQAKQLQNHQMVSVKTLKIHILNSLRIFSMNVQRKNLSLCFMFYHSSMQQFKRGKNSEKLVGM